MTSFTEFKLHIGIQTDTKDTEYASTLKGLIKELYSTYGIALTKDKLTHTETINSTYNTIVELTYKNIVSLTISGFVEGTDYTLNKVTGELTILPTGSMAENTNYSVVYDYYFFINESSEIKYEIYPDDGELFYHIGIKPFTVNNVTYNGTILVEDTDYYIYNNTFELASKPTSVRKPYILNLNVGYEEIPYDLKQAFYELANIRVDMREAKTYLVSKVSDNSEGTSTSYRMDSLPKHIKKIFEEHTGRRFVI